MPITERFGKINGNNDGISPSVQGRVSVIKMLDDDLFSDTLLRMRMIREVSL